MFQAKAKLLHEGINNDIIFSRWRLSKVSERVNIRSEYALNVHVLDIPRDNLALFSREAALRAVHECLGYLPDSDAGNAVDAGHVA